MRCVNVAPSGGVGCSLSPTIAQGLEHRVVACTAAVALGPAFHDAQLIARDVHPDVAVAQLRRQPARPFEGQLQLPTAIADRHVQRGEGDWTHGPIRRQPVALLEVTHGCGHRVIKRRTRVAAAVALLAVALLRGCGQIARRHESRTQRGDTRAGGAEFEKRPLRNRRPATVFCKLTVLLQRRFESFISAMLRREVTERIRTAVLGQRGFQ